MSVINTDAAGANLSTSRMVILVHAIIGMLQSVVLYCQDDFNVSPQKVVDELTNIIIGAVAAAKR